MMMMWYDVTIKIWLKILKIENYYYVYSTELSELYSYTGDYVSFNAYSTNWKTLTKSERARGIQKFRQIMAYPYGHIRVLCCVWTWNNRRRKKNTENRTYQHIFNRIIIVEFMFKQSFFFFFFSFLWSWITHTHKSAGMN